jgi:hypothetical protein
MVPRGELFQLVWPGRVVEDQNLKVQVVALRKLLGEAIIQTVPGRGYRFAAEVDDGGTTTIAPPPAPTPPPSAAAPTNLGAALGTLFGREGDLAALHGLLAATSVCAVPAAYWRDSHAASRARFRPPSRRRVAGRLALARRRRRHHRAWLRAVTQQRRGLARSLAAFRLPIVLDNRGI